MFVKSFMRSKALPWASVFCKEPGSDGLPVRQGFPGNTRQESCHHGGRFGPMKRQVPNKRLPMEADGTTGKGIAQAAQKHLNMFTEAAFQNVRER